MSRNIDISMAHKMGQKMTEMGIGTGTSFVLVMRNKSRRATDNWLNNFSFHPRFCQPCYGELRKYPDTHGAECTQEYPPHKPSDLHWPFPDGEPVGVGVPWYASKVHYDFFRAVTDLKISPFRRGLPKNQRDIHILSNSAGAYGIYVSDTNFDPTVFVSLLWFIRQYIGVSTFKTLCEAGATEQEALVIMTMNNGLYCGAPHYNYHRAEMDARLVFTGSTWDLTGGTLRDRWDYNRKEIQNVFRPEKLEGFVPLWSFIQERQPTKSNAWGASMGAISVEELIKISREYFQQVGVPGYEKQEEIVLQAEELPTSKKPRMARWTLI